MKPADRALNMVVVGLGQAGGNLATEFARLGYRAMALNTAHTDLSSLAGDRAFSLAPEQRVYIGIDGYDGAGADMNYGKECVQENAERIRNVVGAHVEGADVVIITAGLGGGTGSSVSELVRVLSTLDVPLIVMATLPNEYESGIAKVNAVRAVSDLVKQPNVGWIFADNHRLSQLHGGVSLDKYFEKINSVIIAPLDAFNRLNDRKGVYPIRTLDGEDFRALLLSNGIINYSETTISALTVDAVCDRVRETLTSSAMMPAGFASEEVAYMGVVLESSEDILRGTPFSFYEQLNEQLKHDTGGSAIYMGVYRTDRPIENGAALLRVIASTQALPAGVQTMVNDARREGGTLRDKLQRSMSALDLGEIEDFDLFKTTLRGGNPQGHRSRRPPTPQLVVPEVPMRRASGRATQDSPAKSGTPEGGSGDADPDPAPALSTPPLATPALATPAPAAVAAPAFAAPAFTAPEPSAFTATEPSAVSATEPSAVSATDLDADEALRFSPSPSERTREVPGFGVPNFDDDTAVGTSEQLAAVSAEGGGVPAFAEGSAPFEGVAVSEERTTDPTAEERSTNLSAGEADVGGAALNASAESEFVAEVTSSELDDADEEGLVDAELDEADASDAVLIDEEVTDVRGELSTFQEPAWVPSPSELPPLDPSLDALRSSEAEGYTKLVSTFLRTEFDSTRRRVARRLNAARSSADPISRQLAERAMQRVRDAGQLQSFEEALTDGPTPA